VVVWSIEVVVRGIAAYTSTGGKAALSNRLACQENDIMTLGFGEGKP